MINVWRGSLDYPWVSLLLTVYIQSWDLLQQNHINSYKVKSAMGEGIGFWSPFCGIKQDISEYLRSKLTVWKCLPVKFGKDLVPRILCVYVCVCWYVHMSPGALEARSVRFSGAGVTGVVSHLIQIFRTELLNHWALVPRILLGLILLKAIASLKRKPDTHFSSSSLSRGINTRHWCLKRKQMSLVWITLLASRAAQRAPLQLGWAWEYLKSAFPDPTKWASSKIKIQVCNGNVLHRE